MFLISSVFFVETVGYMLLHLLSISVIKSIYHMLILVLITCVKDMEHYCGVMEVRRLSTDMLATMMIHQNP
ncbi:hypothetical protein, partial [Klebsiella pneumoniae]|uniref:hypothetical protein n=1 Tax=Klebsiella pneumoniae TaxID=573 RepID=UPI003A806A0D